jgi:hypothetical protein
MMTVPELLRERATCKTYVGSELTARRQHARLRSASIAALVNPALASTATCLRRERPRHPGNCNFGTTSPAQATRTAKDRIVATDGKIARHSINRPADE